MGAGRYYEVVTDSEGNYEITEIDRIVKELERCKDIEKCVNIILDLDTMINEELQSEKRGEKLERAIECGLIKIILMKSSESSNYVLCDMYGAVLSHFINGLKIKEEMTIEGKKKIIISNIIEACTSGTEIVREKGIEAIIEYGSSSLSNGAEVVFDGMVGMMIEKIKNERTLISEKKNIIILLDNIISNGISLKEEKEILRTASELEEEGRKMIIKEGISKEERKEWKELIKEVLLLETMITDKEEGRDGEKKSYTKMKEEKEKEKKEKEEAIREKEEEKKRKEEEHERAEKEKKEKEDLKKELEEIKRNKESNISQSTTSPSSPSSLFSLFSLSSVSLSFSDNTKMKREGNKIIHNGDNEYESCIFDYEMKKVYL